MKEMSLHTISHSNQKRSSWAIFIFLFAAFFLTLKYDPFFSIRFLHPEEEIENVDFIINSISLINQEPSTSRITGVAKRDLPGDKLVCQGTAFNNHDPL